MRTLVLWDVDLTLVAYDGLGRDWYEQVIATVLGTPFQGPPSFPGRTERSIVTELLRAHGAEVSEERIQAMYRALRELGAAEAHTLPDRGTALPGAEEALAAVAERSDMVQTLVTGNLPEIAEYKVGAFGLDRHLDLATGGYGHVSEHRVDLVDAAISAASTRHGRDFGPESVAVVGDTPAHVDGALRCGARAVGVATGRHSAGELASAGAYAVLPDLTDTDHVLATLAGDGG